MRRSRLLMIFLLVILIVIGVIVFTRRHGSAPAPAASTNATATQPSKATASKAQPSSKPEFSLTDPKSIWVIVNKRRPLDPKDYQPATTSPDVAKNQAADSENMQVGAVMAPALKEMFDAAKTDGINLSLASGYRSYTTQVTVYGREVTNGGQAAADKVSARPGYSEHQTGLAADVSGTDGQCIITECFGDRPEGIWVRDNAYKYGFIIRYPADKTAVTGYSYEPWHVRYIGKDLAKTLHDKKIETLEEYFGTDAAPDY